MKRFISLLLMMMAMTYSIAQNAEPNYITVDVEINDTAKAIEMAEQRREEIKKEVASEYELIDEEYRFFRYIKKKIKKEKDIQMMSDIIDRCLGKDKLSRLMNYQVLAYTNQYHMENNIDRIKENLQNGIVDPVILKDRETISQYLFKLSYFKLTDREIDKFKVEDLVKPYPKKIIKEKRLNPNFAYRWLSRIEKSELNYNPLKMAYTSSKYPQYVFKECDIDCNKGKRVIALFDKSNNLISTQMSFLLNDSRNDIVDACCWYDLKHNAYGINDENPNIRKCIEAILKGEVPINDEYLLGAALQSNLIRSMARQSLRTGALTFAEYNEVIKGNDAALKKQQMNIERKMKQYSKETIEMARSYVRALKDYNSKLVDTSFDYERNDALEGLITFNKLIIKQHFSYFEDEKKIVSEYEVIKKEIPN